MTGRGAFSRRQRALTLLGLAPAVLIGAVGHAPAMPEGPLAAPSYQTWLPVPAAAPRPSAPAGLAATVLALRSQFGGLAGIAVRHVEDGWTVETADASRRMPQQSVSKLWVTMAALDQVDQGRLSLDEQITVRREDLTLFHQPIAGLVRGAGYTTTVRDLIGRAMMSSDNTANDRLLGRIGGPAAVRAFLTKHALIDSIRFGPGERLLQAGTAGLTWRQDYAMGRAFEAARAKLPPGVRQTAFQNYVADPVDGATPSAIAAALARLKRGAMLSPASTAYLLGVMEGARTGKYRIRGAVPPGWRFGHKTGTGQNLGGRTAGFNDVGLLTAPDGQSYAIAVMIGDTRRPVPERQQLMQAVAAAVVAHHRPLGPPASLLPTSYAAPR